MSDKIPTPKHKRIKWSPALYAVMYPKLVKIARRFGYALAIHGSMTRDMDLIAVPWVEDHKDPLDMIYAFRKHLRGVFHKVCMDDWYPDASPTEKPHGRKAYSIHLTEEGCYGPYLDISIMPSNKL